MVDETLIREQNPWWISKDRILEDDKIKEAFSRNSKLLYSFERKSNMLFFGPRQTGKTTYFKLLIYDLLFNKGIDPKKVFYFSCEMLRNFEEIIELVRKLDMFIEGEKYVFLDEISFVENWERAVKYILDSPLSKEKIFYITGSSSLALKKESFPGRAIEIKEFLPLSFRSFINIFGSEELKKNLEKINFINLNEVFGKAKKMFFYIDELNKLFFKYLKCGGFPRAFYELMENGDIKEETYDIYWKWLIHDIAKINRSEKIVSGLLLGILKNYSTKFSLSSIAKEVEIGSHVTVREYLEILEDLFVIKNFHTFDLNKKLVVYRKMRKVYFIDPFLYHVIQRKLTGKKEIENYEKIVEGIVVENLTRCIKDKLKIGFYHNKKEIDICFGDFGIEVKWQEGVSFKDFPKVDIKNKIILSKDILNFDEANNILILPVSLFLSLIS
ncbi:MAG: ATP-binding protein [Candidatus Aenigmatarchaeota archaeon]|nr:ATP-binding protein [Candidatus Aenigmarchaeota archaeon]